MLHLQATELSTKTLNFARTLLRSFKSPGQIDPSFFIILVISISYALREPAGV
jgi:hypothetical protein